MKTQIPPTATISQLAAAYGVHPDTMKKWLRIAGIKHNPKRRLYTASEIQKIIQELGPPYIETP